MIHHFMPEVLIFDKHNQWREIKSKLQLKPNQVQGQQVELTWDEKQYACSKGFVKPVKGGVMDECHDANDDAKETGQKREDHEGTCGI